MNLSEWREARKAGEPYTLPSGLVVKLRRLQLLDLVEQGQIPAPLLSVANKLLTNESTDLTTENWEEYEPVFNLMAKACITDPPIADEPDKDHMGVKELPVVDRLAVYNWSVNSVLAAVIPFRPEQDGDDRPGPDGQKVRTAAERSAGDR
jgi:hypothetical protein